jgi:hypothetical protein
MAKAKVGNHSLPNAFRRDNRTHEPVAQGPRSDEQAKPAPDHDPGLAADNTARVHNFDLARLTVPA